MAAVKSRSIVFTACPTDGCNQAKKTGIAQSEMQKVSVKSEWACFPKSLGIHKTRVNESAEYTMKLAFAFSSGFITYACST